MALPESAALAAQIQSLQAFLAGLPAAYNPQRRSLAYETAAGLNEQGYYDNALPQETNEGGNLVYRIVRGPDGRIYRQAFRQNVNEANARGTLYSSFTDKAQREDKRGLDIDRERILRGFGTQQADLFTQQAQAYGQTASELGQARGSYADWQAQQPVALPEPAPMPAAPSMPGAPSAPSLMPNPNILWTGQAAPNRATLDKRYGAGMYDVKKRGPKVGGFVVTRRQ